MDDDCECEECEEGAPAWLATFADLMSLLMCFFVLLLSFSEMDLKKYKQVAGSMKAAFGVQKTIEAESIPRGTSIIKQEFSPGKPEPTIMKVIQQQTENDSRDELRVNSEVTKEVEELLQRIEERLEEEIDEEMLEIIGLADGALVRVREADSFASGSARLQPSFKPVLDKMQDLLDESTGQIIVSGHTDNIPISTVSYPSNWVLSAARAASVVHYLSEKRFTDPSRVEIRAFADTKPLTANNTVANRARNRRIEIFIGAPKDRDASEFEPDMGAPEEVVDESDGEIGGLGIDIGESEGGTGESEGVTGASEGGEEN